jgi:hypothetical protein
MGELKEFAEALSELARCRIMCQAKPKPSTELKQKTNQLTRECMQYRFKLLGLLLERYPPGKALQIEKRCLPLLVKVEHDSLFTNPPKPNTKTFKIKLRKTVDALLEADKLQVQYRITPETFFSSFPHSESGQFELLAQLLRTMHICDDMLDRLVLTTKTCVPARFFMNFVDQFANESYPIEKALKKPNILEDIRELFYAEEAIKRGRKKKAGASTVDYEGLCRKIENSVVILRDQLYLAICNFPLSKRLKAEAWIKSFPYDGRYKFVMPDEYEALVYRISRGDSNPETVADVRQLWQREFEIAKQNKVNRFSPSGLTNCPMFWSPRLHYESVNFASMMRTAEWAEITGFDSVFKFILQEEYRGGLVDFQFSDIPAILLDLFFICRTNFAMTAIGDFISLAIKRIGQLTMRHKKAPWEIIKTEERHIIFVPSIATAAHFLFVATIVGEHNMGLESEACQFLIRNQNLDGSWSSPSCLDGNDEPCILTTAEVVHALCLQRPPGYKKVVTHAIEWLWKMQQQEGMWDEFGLDEIIYLAVLVLDAIDLAEGKTDLTFKLPESFTRLIASSEPDTKRVEKLPRENEQNITPLKTIIEIDANQFNRGRTFKLLEQIVSDTGRKGIQCQSERTLKSLRSNLRKKGYDRAAKSIEWKDKSKTKIYTTISVGQIYIINNK